MHQVTVKKQFLKDKLEENLKKHIEEHSEALIGYKEKALEILNEQIEEVKNGKSLNTMKLSLQVPQSFEKEYKRAIGMLDICEDEAVTITAEEYDSYIMDEWDWKRNWSLSNTQYLTKKFK